MRDAICAIATPKGGAIGIVRLSGEESISIAAKLFEGHCPLEQAQPNTVHFGRLMDGEKVLDEVLVTVFRAPHSYTAEDSVEISCHGSQYILEQTLALLIKNGCRLAEAGEFTQRAFLNGKMDLSQAEAVADLIRSDSEASHRVALSQMRGSVSHKLSKLRSQLIQMLSLMELELDFSEEDVEFADRSELLQLAREIETEISRLVSSFKDGNALKDGIPVAILGAPNVGKSTLLNQLVGEERAIVSDIEGTTRDLIEDTLTIDGQLFRFIDTAGLRISQDRIEQIGIERAMETAKKARIIILVTEPGIPYPDLPLSDEQTVIRILNKSSEFQALTGLGIKQLKQQLVAAAPKTEANSVLITNARHRQALENALLSIQAAIEGLCSNTPSDLVAEDLNHCASSIGEITGEITNQDILKSIFSSFCVGK